MAQTRTDAMPSKAVVLIKRLFNIGRTRLGDVTVLSSRRDVPRGVQKALFNGKYERFERLMVEAHVKRGDKVLEIGVGVGLISLVAASRAGAGNVFSYEANPAVEDLIRRNYALNDLHPTLTMKAVTADGRALTFYQDAKVLSSSIFDRKLEGGKVTVESEAIQTLIDRHAPNVLVMDVEGAELEILPAADLSGVDRIIVEMHPHVIGADKVDALVADLVAQGFTLTDKQSITYYLAR